MKNPTTLTFEEFLAAREKPRSFVRWRRASQGTWKGWTGKARGPELVWVSAGFPPVGGWEYGRMQGAERVVVGTAHAFGVARREAAALLMKEEA